MLSAQATLLSTLPDTYGAPLAEFYHDPTRALMYIRWHGNLTAAEVIRGVKEGSRFLQQYAFVKVLNDKRDTAGDWSEALPWLQYEWRPQAVAAGLRAIAYIISPHLEARIVSLEFVEAMRPDLHVSLFTNEEDARRWLAGE